MVEFYFLSDKEVSRFCEGVFRELKSIEFLWKQHEDFGNCIQLEIDLPTVNEETLHVFATSFVDVFMTFRLRPYIRKILRTTYYFENETEMNHIIDVSQWILLGEDTDSKVLREAYDIPQALYNMFLSMVKSGETIYFDSTCQFRIASMKELFIEHVGLAIDDYKREEEHQAYVHMLREYVSGQESTTDEIHVIQGSSFQFFKGNGKKMAPFEIKSMMHHAPLYVVGLDADEFNLAPLVALSPKHIYVYGDDSTDPKTVMVMNVFQERVSFYPLYHFPFSLKRNQ
ncbi:MAG TPA: sporulation protein YtxC [Bacillota bacterium]|nr:sporulation protein YtxC [Bacillota bacterium]